jgi:hypothetical protein
MFYSLNKSLAFLSALILAGTVSTSHAGGLNVNVDIGVPAPVPPPPVYAPAPPPAYVPPPPVMLPATPPQFVYVPELGYYVAIGTPYDIAYIGHDYYINNNGYWYRTSYYGGPLIRVERRMWPSLLVRHNLNDFRRFRDVEFRRYDRDREHYRGQVHRPEVRKEERRDVRKEERFEGERR